MRALALLLRHSGPRIQDALTLRRERITNASLLLYTAKSRVPVYCPLPFLWLRPSKQFPHARTTSF